MRLSSWLRSARCLFEPSGTKQGRRPSRHTKSAQPTRLGIIQLEDRTVPSTFSVLNLADSGADSLRAAIAAANANAGADEIDFAPGLKGTVVLTSGELTISDDVHIDGPGASRIAISGNDASRVFKIEAGADVSIDGLTITRGNALLRGGGIWNFGTLTISHSVVSDNAVVGLPGVGPAVDAMGGGILNNGTLAVSNTLFAGNRSTGGDGVPGGPGSTGLGGAIMSAGGGTATLSHSTFIDNRAAGGTSGAGATFARAGVGGAVVNTGGTMTVSHSLFRDNQAIGGAGGFFPGGAGVGGAIANVSLVANSTLFVSDSVLTNNRAIGGFAPPGTSPQPGRGGGIANYTVAIAPVPRIASATVTRSALIGNQAIGGDGPTGGDGLGGGILNENGAILSVSDSLIALNRAIGGAGSTGNGGNGFGGGIYNGPPNAFGSATLTLNGSFVVLNQADGGSSDGGLAGLGVGGGVYVAPGSAASADRSVILANDASTSDDDVFGILV